MSEKPLLHKPILEKTAEEDQTRCSDTVEAPKREGMSEDDIRKHNIGPTNLQWCVCCACYLGPNELAMTGPFGIATCYIGPVIY